MTDDASGCRPARTACGLHLVNARRFLPDQLAAHFTGDPMRRISSGITSTQLKKVIHHWPASFFSLISNSLTCGRLKQKENDSLVQVTALSPNQVSGSTWTSGGRVARYPVKSEQRHNANRCPQAPFKRPKSFQFN